MKPASIISIFVSLVLIVGGYILCAQARDKAPSDAAIDGNTLVNEDGEVITEVSLEGQTFTTVNVNVENCKVEIHGDSEESSITLVNFNENTYIAAAGEKVLTISNKVSVLDYLNFNGTGVKFSGVWKTLRSFLNYDTSNGEREIHVYIAKDADISKVNISCSDSSNLQVLNLEKDCDISFTANDSTLELSNIGAAAMTISGNNSEITLGNANVTSFEYLATNTSFTASGVVAEHLNVDTKSSDISLLNSDFRNISTNLESGDFVLSTKYDDSSYFRKITITEGEVKLDGMTIGQSYNSPEGETAETKPGTMTITVKTGKIDLTFGGELIPSLEPETPETPATPAA